MPLDVACVIGCAVQTGVGAVLEHGARRGGRDGAGMGLGGIGLSIVQGARVAGAARIIAADPVPARREAARALRRDRRASIPARRRRRTRVGADRASASTTRSTPSGAASLVQAGLRRDAQRRHHRARSAPRRWTTRSPSRPRRSSRISEKKLLGCALGSCNSVRDIPRLIALWQAGRLDLESAGHGAPAARGGAAAGVQGGRRRRGVMRGRGRHRARPLPVAALHAAPRLRGSLRRAGGACRERVPDARRVHRALREVRGACPRTLLGQALRGAAASGGVCARLRAASTADSSRAHSMPARTRVKPAGRRGGPSCAACGTPALPTNADRAARSRRLGSEELRRDGVGEAEAARREPEPSVRAPHEVVGDEAGDVWKRHVDVAAEAPLEGGRVDARHLPQAGEAELGAGLRLGEMLLARRRRVPVAATAAT